MRLVEQESTGLTVGVSVAGATTDNRGQVPDVEGGEMRPMRIALVLLPRDCASYPMSG